jgi:hypothetical protein
MYSDSFTWVLRYFYNDIWCGSATFVVQNIISRGATIVFQAGAGTNYINSASIMGRIIFGSKVIWSRDRLNFSKIAFWILHLFNPLSSQILNLTQKMKIEPGPVLPIDPYKIIALHDSIYSTNIPIYKDYKQEPSPKERTYCITIRSREICRGFWRLRGSCGALHIWSRSAHICNIRRQITRRVCGVEYGASTSHFT